MIYFDNAATTAPSKTATEAFLKASECFANPSSTHFAGIEADGLMRKSRGVIAKTLGAKDSEIIFTPSGTFANNLAILGAARAKKRSGDHVIISDSEHPSVYNTAFALKKEGFKVSTLKTEGGKICAEELKALMTPKTVLVSVMLTNNETGAIYDVKKLVKAAKSVNKNVLFHCDAVQAYLKQPISVGALGVDMLTVSSHKIHAFKGSGALYIKSGVRLEAITYGGGQEKALCSGTESVPLIYAFAAAAEEKHKNLLSNSKSVAALKARATDKLSLLGCTFNTPENASPYILSVSVPGVRSEILLNYLSREKICVSAGSACSAKVKENRVLSAFGLSDKISDSTVRISFSEYNTEDEVDTLVSKIESALNELAKNI